MRERAGWLSHTSRGAERDALPDVGQQLEEVVAGDSAAVLTEERRKPAIHVQASLGVFEHLSGTEQPKVSSDMPDLTEQCWERGRCVLLGRPGEGHPVLAQALARLFGRFQHLLSRLQHPKQAKCCLRDERDADGTSESPEKYALANLARVRRFHVRLGAMRDAVLQHLLHPRHQEDVSMGVGH